MQIDDTEKLFGDKKIPTGIMLSRMMKYVKPELGKIIISLFFVLLNVGFDIALPMIIKQITSMTQDIANTPLYLILIFAGSYFLLALIGQIFMYFESVILQKCGQRIVYRLRMEIFSHIEEMSQDQLNIMPVGSLVTRVASYTASISDLFTKVLVNIIKNLLTIVGVYVILFFNSWKIALVISGIITIVFIGSYIFSTIVHKLFKKERAQHSALNSFLSENLSGMKVIQAFNQEDKKIDEFNTYNNQLSSTKYKEILCFSIYRPSITFIYLSSVALTFVLSQPFEISGPTLVAINLYLTKFFEPVQKIADELNHIQRALTATERLFNLLDVKPDVLDTPEAQDIEKFEGHIEFKNVWFAYKPDEWILKDVSFEILPKQTCAFVGATGAGKTTILSLIVRNYEIQKGQILIDGIDIRKITVKSLRKAIGQMLQDVFLFSGTIKDNITLHEENITDNEVMEACKYVNANTVFETSEKGLNEEVIENGENYSQGQRQLLSFARTIMHKPQILILDEATANIDTETELLIQDSLEKMKSIGTMLVVAHRLSTIQKADQIIVLQSGKVIEKGNHQELLKQRGHYYKLYKLQFQDK